MDEQQSRPQESQPAAQAQEFELYRLNQIRDLIAGLDLDTLIRRLEAAPPQTMMATKTCDVFRSGSCPALDTCGTFQ